MDFDKALLNANCRILESLVADLAQFVTASQMLEWLDQYYDWVFKYSDYCAGNDERMYLANKSVSLRHFVPYLLAKVVDPLLLKEFKACLTTAKC